MESENHKTINGEGEEGAKDKAKKKSAEKMVCNQEVIII